MSDVSGHDLTSAFYELELWGVYTEPDSKVVLKSPELCLIT